jgi:death-on-curing protein
MQFVTLSEVLELHRRVLEQSRGLLGIRDLGGLESALAQPRMTFGGEDLYPSLIEKASALGFSTIQDHRRQQAYRSCCNGDFPHSKRVRDRRGRR